eukprot:CAMPEP_0114983084 /NCGR_PEP_ID=MMETSP0216-20121206/6496_1 /TAXON_ID=223996 /ORGANISM="Protocruzia adherens, Strain Boccale" /LENGTH=502 /DNA_ID=CAMNT_0002345013 /DNA_START=47 /DNA_END=1555 /DNA_ORIENTATION=-
MGIYVGFTLIKTIQNQTKYEQVLNEILQYLKAHEHEISLKIESGGFISFSALFGGDCISFPLMNSVLRTTYFRIHHSQTPPEDVKQFSAIAWECLNILKENFPSRIELFQENLECCAPNFRPTPEYEELRRQISCVMSYKSRLDAIDNLELEDLWYVFEQAFKQNDERGINVCLEIMCSSDILPTEVLKKSSAASLKLLEHMTQTELTSLDMSGGQLAKIVLSRIYEGGEACDTSSILSERAANFANELNFEEPSSLNGFLFQLSATDNPERVTFLLKALSKVAKQRLPRLIKLKWPDHLISIVKKYCNGDYGFDDNKSSKNGAMQLAMIKCLIVAAADEVTAIQLLKDGIFDYLFQMIEESCLYIYTNAINNDNNKNFHLIEFVTKTLNFSQLFFQSKHQETLKDLHTSCKSLEERISLMGNQQSILSNQLQSQFKISLDNMDPSNRTDSSSESNLVKVSPDLNVILNKVRSIGVKIESVREIEEDFFTKFERIFPEVMNS